MKLIFPLINIYDFTEKQSISDNKQTNNNCIYEFGHLVSLMKFRFKFDMFAKRSVWSLFTSDSRSSVRSFPAVLDWNLDDINVRLIHEGLKMYLKISGNLKAMII